MYTVNIKKITLISTIASLSISKFTQSICPYIKISNVVFVCKILEILNTDIQDTKNQLEFLTSTHILNGYFHIEQYYKLHSYRI